MSDLVPAEEIEQIVGAKRHPTKHLGRADSTKQEMFILHSQECKDSGIDLRACLYSQALDQGISEEDWAGWEDAPVVLAMHWVRWGRLVPETGIAP